MHQNCSATLNACHLCPGDLGQLGISGWGVLLWIHSMTHFQGTKVFFLLETFSMPAQHFHVVITGALLA